MSLVQLDIRGISYSQTQSGAYALVLSENEGERTLPIVIGAFEAQSIAIALESEIIPPRPLTHDLFKTFAQTYEVNIKEVVIYKLIDGVFYSKITCVKNEEETTIDARTSDAIALAIRFNAPIFTSENILEKAGIHLQNEEFDDIQEDTDLSTEEEFDSLIPQKTEEPTSGSKFEHLNKQELEEKLNIAIEAENYELAAVLRDELNKR